MLFAVYLVYVTCQGGRGYFALYGYSENLKNLLLHKCQADFQIIF